MTNNIINIRTHNTIVESKDKITETLSKYTEKVINENKSVTYIEIPTTYFLENDKWHLDFFGDIEQFKQQVKNYKYSNKKLYELSQNQGEREVFEKLYPGFIYTGHDVVFNDVDGGIYVYIKMRRVE